MRACVLTISTAVAARTEDDVCGPVAAELAEATGLDVAAMEVVGDDYALIEDRLHHYVDQDFALIVTVGGTGPAPGQVAPEATDAVIGRPMPGIAEAIRAAHGAHDPTAALERGTAGLAGGTLIVNLPAAEAGVRLGFAALAPVLDRTLALLRPDETDDR